MNAAEVTEVAELIIKLEPPVQEAVVKLIKAFHGGDDADIRSAYEATRRAAFIARQK